MNANEKNTRAKVALGMVLMGLVLAGVAAYELFLTEEYLDPGEDMGLLDLVEQWPKVPPRVRLKGFEVAQGRFSTGFNSPNVTYRDSWLPLYAKAGNDPKIVAVAIVSAASGRDEDLRPIYQQKALTCSGGDRLSRLQMTGEEAKELRRQLMLGPLDDPLLLRASVSVDKTYLKVLLVLGPVLFVLGLLWLLLILHYRPEPQPVPPFFPRPPRPPGPAQAR